MEPVQLLLVEEEDTIRAFLQKLLRRDGYVVAGFPSSVEALRCLLGGFIPRVVIGNLRQAAGQEIKQHLEQHPTLFRVPFLATPGDAARILDRLSELVAAQPTAPPDLDAVDFVVANYGFMAEKLPSLLARVRELSEKAGVLDDVKDSLDAAKRGGRHMRSFVRYLREYGHAADGIRASTDVRQALGLALEIAEHQITQRARLVREIGPLPLVMANDRQLSHLFLEIISNAAQAIPEGHAEENSLRVTARTDENGWAVVEIADSGAGIAPENVARIFEPYFSTKEGVGLGLGLYLSRRYLTEWGGSINCVSTAPGKGSTFRVELPPAAPRVTR